ncbi:MAG: hypothetical protein ACTSW1_18650 [Candidatus Hodarchaeales archaeon]
MSYESCSYHPSKKAKRECTICGKRLCRSCGLKTVVEVSDLDVHERIPYTNKAGRFLYTALSRNRKYLCPDCFTTKSWTSRPKIIHWFVLLLMSGIYLNILNMSSALETSDFDLLLIYGGLGLPIYWILFIKETLGYLHYKKQKKYAEKITNISVEPNEVPFFDVITRSPLGIAGSGAMFLFFLAIIVGFLISQDIETLQLLENLAVGGLFYLFVPVIVLVCLYMMRHDIAKFFDSLFVNRDYSFVKDTLMKIFCYIIGLVIVTIILIILMV